MLTVVAAGLAALGWQAGSALASTHTVTNTSDSGAGSLRQAITNANGHVGTDTIHFSLGSRQQTIAPASQLPKITDNLKLQGQSQPGYAGTPLIKLDGSGAPSGSIGLRITGSPTIVQALDIVNWDTGIEITDGGGSRVLGNYIGTDAAGAGPAWQGAGVVVDGSRDNRIGVTQEGARNVVSGNEVGIVLAGPSAKTNAVQGNFIGTTASGNDGFRALSAASDVSTSSSSLFNLVGVLLVAGARHNTIGGTDAGAGNLIGINFIEVLLPGDSLTLAERRSVDRCRRCKARSEPRHRRPQRWRLHTTT